MFDGLDCCDLMDVDGDDVLHCCVEDRALFTEGLCQGMSKGICKQCSVFNTTMKYIITIYIHQITTIKAIKHTVSTV
jgi:hypothetical protein